MPLAPEFFRGRVLPVTQNFAPGVTGSALGLVGPVSVYCDWLRWKIWSATSISVWQHVKLSEQIRPWDTLAWSHLVFLLLFPEWLDWLHFEPCRASAGLFVSLLLNVPATCECISGTDLHRQFYVLPHWDRSCRSNFLPHPVTVYWHRADQSKRWPYNARRVAG